MRMHPQSELENYKLQVELLQEKLHRSEDNRQELEGKLEQIMKKRNEHEKTLRSRSQQKYQQFLDEQKKRNERNRKLVEMLERINQQAAALSARSERLKMMKLQYELYFSKLVQTYSMKTLKNIPAVSILPMHGQRTTSDAYSTKDSQIPLNNNPTEFQTVPIPVVVPIPNGQNRFQPSWTFASAPTGVLIALPNNATLSMSDSVENKKNQSDICFDYSQFPIGYLQASTPTTPMQYNSSQSYLQQPQKQKPSTERYTKPMFAADDDIKHSRPHFEFREESSSPSSFFDVKTNETFFKRTQPESNQLILNERNKPENYDDLEINEDKESGQEPLNFTKTQVQSMFNKDFPASHQSLKNNKLLNIKPNNSFEQGTLNGSIVHRGNIPNAIDFRTDDDEYIKNIKEMNETYEKNVPVPIDVAPQEHNIDNITTTLQIKKTQKIDETNVRDDEKINDMEDNEKNTSSASVPLDGKCSIGSIGDEALLKKPLEYKTQENTSNTPARNIDPSRDTEQITLFNGTKNSKDESTRASNRTTAVIDGVGENKESIESTRMDLSYRPLHFDKKEKMSIENIETAIYGELLTKNESPTSYGLADNPRGNGGRDEEIELNSQETKEYEFANLRQDIYKQEQDALIKDEQQVASYATEIEEIEQTAVNNADSYKHNDNVTSKEDQQYDLQNIGYSDLSQEYSANKEGNMAQQEYPYAENEIPPKENYDNEYQNYDPSQYQGEYDPNAYQYDYGENQYGDGSQAQYNPEDYGQEYQQNSYTDEYGNYQQVGNNQRDISNEQYGHEENTPYAQEVSSNQNEDDFQAGPQPIETEIETIEQTSDNVNKLIEDEAVEKSDHPTSILSTEKNGDLATKKKKRVNFVDSETDESSVPKQGGASSESDFDFSAN